MPEKVANEKTLPVYNPPELAKWQRERLEQGFFDWILPSRLDWFVTSQATRILLMSVDSVLVLAEQGKLEVRHKQITGARTELLISRRSLLLYIAHTSQLDPKDLAERFIAAIDAVKCTRILALILEGVTKEYKRRVAA